MAIITTTSVIDLNNQAPSSVVSKEVPTSVCQYGLPLKALLTNFSCIFGMQSGVAAINPDTKIRGVLQKRLPVSINWDRLPSEVKNMFRGGEDDEHGKDALLDWVNARIEEYSSEDRVFTYGEEILFLHMEPEGEDVFNLGTISGAVDIPTAFHYCFLKHSKLNQPLIPRAVLGLKKTKKSEEEQRGDAFDNDLTSDIIKFNVVCDLDVTSQWWKLRGDGIKATTCPIHLSFFPEWNSKDDQHIPLTWDVMFGIESLKGGLAYLSAFVNAHEGGMIDVEEGSLTLTDGTVVHLDDKDGPLQHWIKDNTRDLWVEFRMINAEFRSILLKRNAKAVALEAAEVNESTDLVLVSIEEDHVILREKVQVLVSNDNEAFRLFGEVEIATPREGSGTGSHLHEGMILRSFQSEDNSDDLLEASMAGKRETFRMVKMLTAIDEEVYGEAPRFVVTDPKGRRQFSGASELDENSLYWSDSKLMHHLGEKFPNGVVIAGVSQQEGYEEVFLDFSVLASMSTVIGGTAEGIAAEAVAIICLILNPDRSGVDQALMGKLAHVSAGIMGFLSGAITSHSVLKRLMRGKKGLKVAGKIRNCSHIPVLNHEAGELPKVGMSIKDDRLLKMAVGVDGNIRPEFLDSKGHLDVSLMHQAVVGIGRDPMPMTLACELILLELEGYEGEPGTDLICGDGFGFNNPNESTETRHMELEEMRWLREGNEVNPEDPTDVGFSKGTNAAHEGDSDGDGDTVELIEA